MTFNSYASLRELYLSTADKSDLNKTVNGIESLFSKEKFSKELTLNFFNLQQVWLRLDSIVKICKIDPGLEFAFSELLGHFYAAESIFFEVTKEQSNALKVFQSVKASQEVLTDLVGFLAKLALTGANPESLVFSLDKVLSLNAGSSYREEIAKELVA